MTPGRQLELLPPSDLPEGLRYLPDFLSVAEESALVRHVRELSWQEVRMHGVIARRRVVHFGLDYAYASREVSPAAPPPEWLKPLIGKGAKACGCSAEAIAEILVTEYPPGAGIGWHRDAPAFGDVFGVSLGGPCTMKFRLREDARWRVVKIELEPRSAYVISGRARGEWQHAIPHVKTTRCSITLRTLRAGPGAPISSRPR